MSSTERLPSLAVICSDTFPLPSLSASSFTSGHGSIILNHAQLPALMAAIKQVWVLFCFLPTMAWVEVAQAFGNRECPPREVRQGGREHRLSQQKKETAQRYYLRKLSDASASASERELQLQFPYGNNRPTLE